MDITACAPSICIPCGTYVSQADSSHYIELHSGGTAYLHEGRFQTSGTWKSIGTEILMKWQGDTAVTRAEWQRERIVDDDGIVWVKQAEDASGAGTSAPPF